MSDASNSDQGAIEQSGARNSGKTGAGTSRFEGVAAGLTTGRNLAADLSWREFFVRLGNGTLPFTAARTH